MLNVAHTVPAGADPGVNETQSLPSICVWATSTCQDRSGRWGDWQDLKRSRPCLWEAGSLATWQATLCLVDKIWSLGEGLPAQPQGPSKASEKSGTYAETRTMKWPGEEMEEEHVRQGELPEARASLACWRLGKKTSLFRATGTAPSHGGVQTAFLL